MALVN